MAFPALPTSGKDRQGQMPRPDHTSQTVFPVSSCVNHSSNPWQHSFREKKRCEVPAFEKVILIFILSCVYVWLRYGCVTVRLRRSEDRFWEFVLTVFNLRIKLRSTGLTFNTLNRFNESQGKVLVRRDPLLQRSWGLSEPSCLFTKIRSMDRFFFFLAEIYFQFKFLFKCMDLLPACVHARMHHKHSWCCRGQKRALDL